MKIIALILAAGRGTRVGSAIPKQWQHLGNKRIIDHSIDLFKDILELIMLWSSFIQMIFIF